MGSALQEFFVALGLDADAAAFASAQTMVDGLEKALGRLVEWANRAADAVAGAVIDTAKYGSELDDTSKKTGFATQALEEYIYASKLVGGGSESFTSAVTHLARKMGEVRNGSKEATAAFQRLGVRVLDGNGKMRELDDVLNDVSDGLAKTAPGAERMNAAFGVMGKGGADAIPLLGEGSAELKRMREEFRQTVGALTNDQVKLLDGFDDGLVTLRAVGAAVTHEFAVPIVEALQPILRSLLDWIRLNRQLISDTVTRWGQRLASVFNAIAGGLGWLLDNGDNIIQVLKLIAMAIAAMGAAALILSLPALIELAAGFAIVAAEAIASAAAAIAAWLAAAAPFLLITALIGLMILALEDFYVWLEGGDSLIGHVLSKWGDKFEQFFTKIRLLMHALGLGLPTELAIAGLGRLSLEVGKSVAGPPRVSDFVSAGASSPSASAGMGATSAPSPWAPSVVRPSTINAPFNITVNAANGQSATEVASETVKRVQEYLEGELRKVQERKE